MSEIVLDRKSKLFDRPKRASLAYGNQLIEDNPLNGTQDTRAWISWTPGQPAAPEYIETATVNQDEIKTPIDDWSYIEDPLTQSKLLDWNDKTIQILIFKVRRLNIFYRNMWADKLVALFHASKEEEPDGRGIMVESLMSLYSFLRCHDNLKCPIISLTPDYNIYASWKGEPNRVFSIHFLTKKIIRFVMFKPNDIHHDQKLRLSGTTTPDTLIETVEPHGVLDWISE